MVVAAGTLFAVALAASARSPRISTQNLFVIERSKNANVVRYDARIQANGALAAEQPVVAYWVLHEQQSQRKSLSFFDRRAYGFDVSRDATGATTLVLEAAPDRPLRLVRRNGRVQARTNIAGQQAVLREIYVKSDESGWLPEVIYVELRGKTVQSGAPITERIEP